MLWLKTTSVAPLFATASWIRRATWCRVLVRASVNENSRDFCSYLLLIQRVERCRRLVQDKQHRVSHQRSRQCETLPLSPTQERPVLANRRHLVKAGRGHRRQHFAVLDEGATPEHDRVAHRATEDGRSLLCKGYVIPEEVRVKLADRHARETDVPVTWRVEPKQQTNDRRFPATRGTDDGHPLTGSHLQIKVVQHRHIPPRLVRKVHAAKAEAQSALLPGSGHAVAQRSLRDAPFANDLEDATRRDELHPKLTHGALDAPHARGHQPRVDRELRQVADGKLAPAHQLTPRAQDSQHGPEAGHDQRAHENAPCEGRSGGFQRVRVCLVVVARQRELLDAEGLDGPDALQALLGVDLREPLRLLKELLAAILELGHQHGRAGHDGRG
eukprot:scaffold5800_cov189-Pinguiococcus_pyrenoidosus.AAC.3